MHYKNGRPVSIGDWVVGKTHNSNGEIRVGIVKETMPLQGPCNVKLHIWLSDYHHDDGGLNENIPAYNTKGKDDYADCAELVKCSDGLTMISAILEHGNWNGRCNFDK